MRLKKDLTQMVVSDYVPLDTTQEGVLRGGFGSVGGFTDDISIFGRNRTNCNGCNDKCPTNFTCVLNEVCPSSSLDPTATPSDDLVPVAPSGIFV